MSLEHRPRALVRGGGELCAAAHHEAMIELGHAPPSAFSPPPGIFACQTRAGVCVLLCILSVSEE